MQNIFCQKLPSLIRVAFFWGCFCYFLMMHYQMIINSQIHLPFYLHSNKICISTNRCFRSKIHSWWFSLFHLPKIQGFLWVLNRIDENINLVDILDFSFPPPLYPIHPFAPLVQPLNLNPSSAPLYLHCYCPGSTHWHLTQGVLPCSSTISSPSTLAPLKCILHMVAR